MSGFAIWAGVSPDVDAKIVDQIQAGTFPIRLQSDEWTSGKTFWLLDVIAPTPALTAAVIANFGQVIAAARGENAEGELELRLHPIVARLVDRETLERIGVRAVERPAAGTSAG